MSDQTSDDAGLASLLYWPLQQLHQYGRVLVKVASCFDVVRSSFYYYFCFFWNVLHPLQSHISLTSCCTLACNCLVYSRRGSVRIVTLILWSRNRLAAWNQHWKMSHPPTFPVNARVSVLPSGLRSVRVPVSVPVEEEKRGWKHIPLLEEPLRKNYCKQEKKCHLKAISCPIVSFEEKKKSHCTVLKQILYIL